MTVVVWLVSCQMTGDEGGSTDDVMIIGKMKCHEHFQGDVVPSQPSIERHPAQTRPRSAADSPSKSADQHLSVSVY